MTLSRWFRSTSRLLLMEFKLYMRIPVAVFFGIAFPVLLLGIFGSIFGMGGGGLTAFVYQMTEPILAPIRRVLPASGGIDWSPLVLMLVIWLLRQILATVAARLILPR